jgi:hypothetical protein
MSEGFDPLGIVAGLIAHGVSYVLVGELAAQERGAGMEADRVDICVPGDQENLARLALALDQLEAHQRASGSEGDHQASFDTLMGRLDCLESTSEFESLDANASKINIGRGVVAHVASLEDLARSKRASADLSGAARLTAFAEVSAPSEARPKRRVKADRPFAHRFDGILEKLASVDSFLTEVNAGERPLGRKKA